MYIVIELQKTGETLSNLSYAYDQRDAAEQKYHQILSAAAVSEVDIHSAVLMLYDGTVIKRETYDHTDA